MNRTSWAVGIFLSLLLIGGVALDVNAQQPPVPQAPAESAPPPGGSPTPPAPQGSPSAQPQQPPSSNTQIETRTERTERIVEQPGKFLGVDPTVAMVVGAVLVIVIVIGLVAMGRRRDEVHHTRHQA